LRSFRSLPRRSLPENRLNQFTNAEEAERELKTAQQLGAKDDANP
jgi:hypothetical protein